MKKTVGATILSTALVCGLGLPAHALGLPGSDPAEGTRAGTVQVLAATATPAAAAQLRPSLRLGSRSPAVVYVQTKLGVKPASGYYGPITAKAVRAAQRSHGLKATGKVSASTWKVLLRSASTTAPAVDPASEPSDLQPAPAPSPREAAEGKPSLNVGSRGPAVVFVQEKLGVAPATGYFGPLTRGAVSALQEINGLKATGKVGPATWKILLAAEGVIEVPLDAPTPATQPAADTNPAPPAPPVPPAPPAPPALTPEQAAATRPLLTPGMGPGDPAVIYVQQYLRVSPATGFFGKLTTGAVTAYQTGLQIPATGTVDAATWDAILVGRTATPVPRPTTPTPPKPSAPLIPTPTYTLPENPTAADRAVVFALAQVGKPYVLGGNGPAVFDCSSLIQQAYLTGGVKLPRLASQQRFAGTRVEIDQLLPGDLLYYQDGSSPRKGHISMYAGNGLVVEAANPRRGVRMRTLHEPWYRDRFVAAVRVA